MNEFSSYHRAGGWRATARLILSVLLALSASGWPATPALAAIKIWTGAASAGWSDPSNWSPAGTPQNGDELRFYADNDSHRTMVNDIPDLRVASLAFETHDYQIDGNPLTVLSQVSNGLVLLENNNFSHTTTINCQMIFPDSAEIHTPASFGLITENTVNLFLNGSITVQTGDLTLRVSANDNFGGGNSHVYVSGVISGGGNVLASVEEKGGHVSTVEFNGIAGNTFSGSLFIGSTGNAPVVFNKSFGFVVTNRLVVGRGLNSAILQLAGPNQIGNSATLQVNPQAQLHLRGNNVTVGSLVLSNQQPNVLAALLDTGTTTVGVNGSITSWNDSDSVIPVIQGHLNLNGVLPFNIGGSAYAGLEMQSSMGSAGGFNKSGSAALLLEAINTFTGPVSVNQGILDVRNSRALGSPAGSTTLSGNGSLTLRNVDIVGEPLFSEGNQTVTAETSGSLLFTTGNCSWSGPIQLDHNLVVFADVTTLSGPITGTAGLDFRNGTAIISGSAGNTFTGTTLVRCSLLEFNKPSGINAYAGPLMVGGGGGGPYEAGWLNSYQNVGATATLYANGLINLNNHNEDFGPVTFNGGEVDTGTGTFNIYAPITVNPSPATAIINGYLGLPPGADRVFIVGDGAADCDLLVNAVVFGSPNAYVVKQGAGTMCLNALNTFNTVTLLEEGILDISSDQALGTWAGLIIFDKATLRISSSGSTTRGFEALGAGVGGTHGAVELLPNNNFSFSGSILLDGAATFNAGGTLGLNGVVSGTGPLMKIGTGALVMGGGGNNTYSGDTVVSSGSLLLARSANKISVPGNLIIGPGPANPTTFARLFQPGALGGTTVAVNANSLFDLNGYYQSLTTLNLRDGGSVQTRAGLLDFPSGGAINVGSLNMFGSHVSASIMGAIGLPANAPLSFNVNSYAPSFPFPSGPELDVLATIPRPVENLGFAPAGIAKNGLGQMRLGANNTYAGSTAINDGTLLVDGTQPQSLVAVNRGTLGGSGTVGDIYMTGSSAVVAPGDNGPGILTCGNLNAGINASGVLRMELNSTTPGSGYDQLNVIGTVNLAGITLERPLGFTPPTGAQFQIINNDGRDLVTGAFNGLPGGGKLYVGGVIYQINYGFGGRLGNDVVLQGLDTPPSPPPTLTIQRLPPASVRLLWPVSDPPFDLQTCTNLDTASWTPALPPPTVSGTNNIVINPASNTQQFYRLISP